jgi:ribosomal protein L35
MEDAQAFQRLFEKIDDLQKQIKVLCDQQTKLKSSFDSHLLIAKEIKQYKQEQEDIYLNKRDIQREKDSLRMRKVFGVTGVLIAIITSVATFVALR